MNFFRKISRKRLNKSRKRHLLKTLTWRILATTTTFTISFFLTGSIKVGAGIAGIEFFVKMIIYYYHERIWFKIDMDWGN